MIDALELFDRNLFLKINSWHSAFGDVLMWQLSADWPTILFSLVFIYFFYKKFQRKNIAPLLLGIALVLACSDISTNFVKHQVKRYRPTHNTEIKAQVHTVNDYRGGIYGFYSSHAANVFGIITFFFLSAIWLNKKKRVLFFLYPLVVGYSRIYLGVHYPSDILTGAVAGIIFGTLVYYIINTYFYKIDRAQV